MNEPQVFDKRRDAIVPGDKGKTIEYAVQHFISSAQESIQLHDYFAVALSGGSTPKAIFEALVKPDNRDKIDWSKVLLFWSDERAVPPDDPESNYKMAMDAGFSELPIPGEHIFRMHAEENIEANALEYEKLIQRMLPGGVFDLVMLGMGEDGHTASLFPETHGLHSGTRWVIANYLPHKEIWRMSLTFPCINAAHRIAIYVIGKSKAPMLEKALSGPYEPDHIPIQRVGTESSRALWIIDSDAMHDLYFTTDRGEEAE